MKQKNICVIGAGASGLVAVKELKEAGHSVTCYEKHDKIAGVFYYSASKGGAYDSTKLTVSNYFMAYSSFPPKKGTKRDYWSWREYSDYLSEFVEHFELSGIIKLNHEVKTIARLSDGSVSVTVASNNGDEETAVFDHVAICTGTNRTPRMLEVEGLDTFTGEVAHSAYYKNASPYAGKRVVCVGIGETGADVVNEISKVAEECTLSIRRHQTITEKYPNSKPYTNDTYTSYSLYAMPSSVQNWIASMLMFLLRYSKDPVKREVSRWNSVSGEYFNQFFTKTEVFLKGVVEKRIAMNVGGIERISGGDIIFKDGTTVAADVLMMNTGYKDNFDVVQDWQCNDIRSLYKHMIDVELRDKIVFIGWARPGAGGVPACSEMQSRYFAKLCAGTMTLPDTASLKESIKRQSEYEDHLYKYNPDTRSLVNYSEYMHDFAKDLDVSPWRLATFMNPKLLYKLWFGSQLSNIYRLYGEGSDHDAAKEVIYRLPNGNNVLQEFGLLSASVAAKVLGFLRLIRTDPKY